MGLVIAIGAAWSPILLFAQPGDDFKPPQDVDGSRLMPGQTTPDGQATSQELAKEKLFDQLFRELDNLIPGDFEEGSAQKKAIEEAITAFQLRDAGRVVEIFKQQADADPDFPPTDLLLAGLSFVVKDQKSGKILLERAAMQHPDSPAVYAAFSRLAINEARNTDGLALLEKLNRLINQNKISDKAKSFYEFLYRDGMIDLTMRLRRFKEARGFLTLQLESLPDNPKVLMVFAKLEFEEKNLEAATGYLQTLKAKLPSTRAPEAIFASWFQQAGNKLETEKWVVEAASKYPDDRQVQFEYASWAVNKEDFPIALDAIKKGETNGGENAFSKSLKGKIAFAEQSYAIAESHYNSLYSANPNNFDVSNMYALCLIENEDIAKRNQALEIANRNYKALPDNLIAQSALGYIRLRLGSVDQAKPAMAAAAQNTGRFPDIDFFVASLLKEMNQNEEAKRVLENALKFEGLFLYRLPAKKLLNKLSASELPEPKK